MEHMNAIKPASEALSANSRAHGMESTAHSQEDSAIREGQKMSDRDFMRLSRFVGEVTGIKMPEVKKTMLQARLQKRLRVLGLDSYSDYCNYLLGPEGASGEVEQFINVVTTNKTDFFREPHHFEFLIETAIPFLRWRGLIRHHYLNVWSAACSSGMEAYTLAMILSEFQETNTSFAWSILGTDISTKVLEKASGAVYREEEIEPVPMDLRRKYLLRSTDREKRLVKIAPALRSRVSFSQLNLMDERYELTGQFEVIFCRNVLIYFDRRTELEILKRISRHLVPGGFLFLGHSESLNGFTLPYDAVGPTVYQKKMKE